VAVVSISRIQIRRGREQAGTGLPQLASGELGWAVDTQRLYIGNGAVSEGAPFVGNTRVLTDKENIFELADDYVYKTGIVQTAADVNAPIKRTLASRLDDIVSIKSFGAEGDQLTDVTANIQRALDELYLNTANHKGATRSRVVLHFEPGTYKISNTIYIPPYATISGAGPEKTVFQKYGDHPAFQTIRSDSIEGDYIIPSDVEASDNATTTQTQPQHIHMSGFSIDMQTDQPAIQLQSCKDSTFSNISLNGTRAAGDSTYSDTDIGIELVSKNTVVSSNNNHFENITIFGFGYGVRSKHNIKFNKFTRCKFDTLGYGIEFGALALALPGQEFGPSDNIFTMCSFDEIDRHAFWITKGTNNLSDSNQYGSVGNDAGTEANASYAVLRFQSDGNHSNNDIFKRTQALGYDQSFINIAPYVPELSGHGIFEQGYANKIFVTTYGSYEKLFRLPADEKKSYEVDYLYVSNQVDATRQGKLFITVNPTDNHVHLVDEYDYIGDSQFEEYLTLNATLLDENADTTLDTVAVNVLNSTSNDDANFYYTVKTKV
jgi:hypothetical protein